MYGQILKVASINYSIDNCLITITIMLVIAIHTIITGITIMRIGW